MKYLLLLNNDARDVVAWQAMSEDEARLAREQEMPRWNELFSWIAEQGIEVNGQELDDPRRVVRRRSVATRRAPRRALRRDEGAARRLLPRRLQ